jgi:hypothetical protein
MSYYIETDWSRHAKTCDDTDALEKHKKFVEYVKATAAGSHPWLFPLLDAVNAKILCGPFLFAYEISAHPGLLFVIPEMCRSLRLLPWADGNESTH